MKGRGEFLFKDNLGGLKSLFKVLELKDHYTAYHSERVAEYSKEVAESFHLSAPEINCIYYGSLLHDIGKIVLPEAILFKPGKLDSHEYTEIKRHTTLGYEIARQTSDNEAFLSIIRDHHERLDGKGYPYGLVDKQIPFMTRIVTVVDAFDAMISHRVYRESIGFENTQEELIAGRGTQFDPDCVDLFICEVLPKFSSDAHKELNIKHKYI
jgi:putative nucleotidyltransferase with HDIG domain